jgi:hypothetical protein
MGTLLVSLFEVFAGSAIVRAFPVLEVVNVWEMGMAQFTDRIPDFSIHLKPSTIMCSDLRHYGPP